MSGVFYQPKIYPVPSEGPHTFCVLAVDDLGEVYDEKYNKETHQLKFHYLVDETDPVTGQPIRVSRRYNMAGGERSCLLPLYRALTGSKAGFIPKGFNFETLIGRNFQGSITHNVKADGTVWANVGKEVFPPNPSLPKVVVPSIAYPPAQQNPPELQAKIDASIRATREIYAKPPAVAADPVAEPSGNSAVLPERGTKGRAFTTGSAAAEDVPLEK